jgi:hypothetical protein
MEIPESRRRLGAQQAGVEVYFVITCLVGVTVFGAASEIENVNQVFQPDGRLAASNSP